jgi:hypothetical protein
VKPQAPAPMAGAFSIGPSEIPARLHVASAAVRTFASKRKSLTVVRESGRLPRRVTTRDATRFHLSHAISLRFLPGPERDAWLLWLAQLNDIARRRALFPNEL